MDNYEEEKKPYATCLPAKMVKYQYLAKYIKN